MSDDQIRVRLAALGATDHFDRPQRDASMVPRPTEPQTSDPVLITADELMRKIFPEPRWAVPGIFPQGLSLLVGAPKLGKSWLALMVAVAIALGGRAMGKIAVTGGDVLYLALEDTERRLQERLSMTLRDNDPPTQLTFATEWPVLDQGGTAYITQWLTTHRDARLVIIDTFQRIRGTRDGTQNIYAGDYEAAGKLKRIADEFSVAVVLIHHTRKMAADDPLDMVSGTTGLAGAADTTCVLRRVIGRSDATLYIRGRDVPNGWGNVTGADLTHRFWQGIVGGGYVTHGETFLRPDEIIWWAKGGTLEGESPARIAFLRRVLEEGPTEGLDLAGEVTNTHIHSAGQVGVFYLTYFGPRQPSRLTLKLPPGQRYEADLIDTWEMTIAPLATSVEQGSTIHLPRKPFQALRLRRVDRGPADSSHVELSVSTGNDLFEQTEPH